MKFRMKISFEAACKRCTIQELILKAILKTYLDRDKQGLIPKPFPYVDEDLVDDLLKSSVKQKVEAALKKEEEENVGAISQMNKDEYKGHLKQKMVSTFVKQIVKKDGVDDIFKEHLDSDLEDDQGIKVEEAVKQPNQILDKEALKKVMKREKTKREVERETVEERKIRLLQNYRKKYIMEKKTQYDECQVKYDNVMLLVTLRIMQGPLFIYALLESIKLSKEMLALSLEQGREVLIPKRLGQKHLALTFQYYDSITESIRQYITDELKVFLCTFKEEERLRNKSFSKMIESLQKKRRQAKNVIMMKNDIKRDSMG